MSKARHQAVRHVLLSEAVGLSEGAAIELEPSIVRHLRTVLRLGTNDVVHATDGAGRLFRAELADGGRVARLQALIRVAPAGPEIQLAVGLPKNATFDWIVEKATECGASSIQPILTSRSVVRLDPGAAGKADAERRRERAQRIADGAIEQSERLWRTRVEAPLAWSDWLRAPYSGATFALISETRAEQAGEAVLRESLGKLQGAATQPLRLVIGPEGGFSPSEREDLLAMGAIGLSLGDAVLRVETAVIAALWIARISHCIAPYP